MVVRSEKAVGDDKFAFESALMELKVTQPQRLDIRLRVHLPLREQLQNRRSERHFIRPGLIRDAARLGGLDQRGKQRLLARRRLYDDAAVMLAEKTGFAVPQHSGRWE